uniref:Syndetin-like n=1 Tax=Dermatophagoides pteronyssinus TaxID=6956 RepID=A0A6P6YA87_DERPT|nr:syndetin-like [Dermatophagoides pteronyssinus]
MEIGKKKFRSILKQVQSSTEVLSPKSSTLSPQNSVCNNDDQGKPTLDLSAAIEYNYCLINSYVQERSQRTLSPYEEIAKTFTDADDEDRIIESIGAEFFLDPNQNADHVDDDNNEIVEQDNGQARIMEQCVLAKLPSLDHSMELLNYIETEKKKLTRQQTIVSKRLTQMILANDSHFQSELIRVRCIEQDLASAIRICADGRRAFGESKRDFTETSMTIIDNHRQRETIVQIIDCLQTIKRLKQTVERIGYMLEYEKNFATAINLLSEQLEMLEILSEKYGCVAEMQDRLLAAIQLVGDQMDAVLGKMCDRFCFRTYQQLAQAYAQLDKTEFSLQQLQLYFANTIHDKAFSIVLGYVKLFSPDHHSSNDAQSSFKSKRLIELCQHLNPESFLQCLVDLCRALWDVMANYHQCLTFYQRQKHKPSASLTKEEIDFAIKKLSYGALRIWSDVQHKIRTLLSSVKFVQQPSEIQSTNQSLEQNSDHHHQDQLLFSFEEFIKILTVSERMIEIGEQFCQLYQAENDSNVENNNNDENQQRSHSPTLELQNTLYQQTRAYIQSYHQVSMFELKIFLENEIWTRCPIETCDEFELIANLHEFSFIKQRLLRMKANEGKYSKTKKDIQTAKVNTLLLSPVASGANRERRYFTDLNPNDDVDDDDDNEMVLSTVSPFDELITRDSIVSQQTFDLDSDSDDDSDQSTTNAIVSSSTMEIVTTNTALNVVRLMGRYMNIMFLLRPISHDIIKALLELFDYYFYSVYHFFAEDALPVPWLAHTLTNSNQQSSSNNIGLQQQSNRLQLNHKFSSFIKRINESLILNEETGSSSSNTTSPSKVPATCLSSSSSSPSSKMPKYPCPALPDYVPIESADRHYALVERIMAIQSMIFIARQFYHLCPLLLEFLRSSPDPNESNVETNQKSEDGFKSLQFYHDKMCSSVASLQYQCLYAVATKLLPYETIVKQMQQTRWDLKEIPSMHSTYVNVIIDGLSRFDVSYRQLLQSHDLSFLAVIPDSSIGDDLLDDMPLIKLENLSRRIPITIWECLLRASNRTFIEGFSTVRKCTNEGRALMQLDYEQFLSHMEKLMTSYYNQQERSTGTSKSNLKCYLANERLNVEEFIKAFYITESTFTEWIRQKTNVYTGKQIVSLINCIAADNKKLRTSLLSAIDASSLDQPLQSTNLDITQ